MTDLMEYLHEEFRKDLNEGRVLRPGPGEGKAGPEMVESGSIGIFVEWARRKLRGNPPVSVMPLSSGLGLRLMDTTEVAIIVQSEDRKVRESIPITNPGFNPVLHGISSVESEPVFGREPGKKK